MYQSQAASGVSS